MPTPIRVLLIEDSDDDADLVVRHIARGGYAPEVHRVEHEAALRQALAQAEAWDVVIADYRLPQFDAMAALGVLRETGLDLPFIIVSGTIGEETAVAAMKAGAHDYVMKDRLARLVPVVEREIREHANRRERRASEEALKSAQEQLRQAQKMEAIGRLAGGVAHDFNNLLTVISGYSEHMLERLAHDSPLRAGADAIDKAARRGATLTRHLLAFSRQQILEPVVLDVNDVVAGVESLLRRVIGEDITLRIECPRDLWRTRADPGQIEQILMNLAVNARDAMPDGGSLTIATGGVHVTEAGGLEFPSGEYVMLSVSDSGHGIAPEILPKIFEPFFTTKAVGKGTGLGLSMVYGVVNQSGGHITVSSEPGRGTTFTILLPRVYETPDTVAPGHMPLVAPAGDETVLVVEDQDDVREFIRETLVGRGYRVLEACNGQVALAAYESGYEQVQLLLTDTVMPIIGGPELARRLALVRPDLKVLFVSGYVDPVALEEGLARAGTAFLAKPFSGHALASAVRDLLDRATT